MENSDKTRKAKPMLMDADAIKLCAFIFASERRLRERLELLATGHRNMDGWIDDVDRGVVLVVVGRRREKSGSDATWRATWPCCRIMRVPNFQNSNARLLFGTSNTYYYH